MSTLQRDLALPEPWQKSLERSQRRRELAARGRKEVARRKGASAAMATAMLAGPAAPFASAAQGGGGAKEDDTSAPASGGERQIEIRAGGLPLSSGYEGDLVAALQQGLGVDADGIFGPITEGAVKAFQRRAGLPVTGVVDPATWQALFSGVASKGTASSPSASSGPVVDLEAPRAAERTVPAVPAVTTPAVKPRARKAAVTSKPATQPRPRGGEREERTAPRHERHSAPKRRSSHERPRNVPAAGGDSNEAPVPVSACGSSTLTKPVKGAIKTSPFGPRGGRNHNGVDLAAPTGTAIRAVACGMISFRGVQSGYGNMICIKHTSRFSTCYAHMSRYAGLSSRRVRAGQVIGYVGCTGSCTGPHLHFETRVDGRARNPDPYLRGGGIPGRPTVKRATVRRAPVRKATSHRTTVKPSARPATTASRWSSAPSRPAATTATASRSQQPPAPAPAPAATAAPVSEAPTPV
ncbi:MAG: peptidoglycan DD-metalloendopeptidase family protein, partial [Actinomycetota bacterium]|nr:peptidoglycan DD-metalloendopeptidase family protein [Actinomycetota bacterium]